MSPTFHFALHFLWEPECRAGCGGKEHMVCGDSRRNMVATCPVPLVDSAIGHSSGHSVVGASLLSTPDPGTKCVSLCRLQFSGVAKGKGRLYISSRSGHVTSVWRLSPAASECKNSWGWGLGTWEGLHSHCENPPNRGRTTLNSKHKT